MFAYARNMFSLSRAGYYPRGLSVTNSKNVPLVALIVGALIGFAALLAIAVLTAVDAEGAGAVAGAVVLNIAVWGAMLAYMMQAVSFLILRKKLPNLKRPYKSPWGVPGAWAAVVIAGISFVGYLINPGFQTAIAGIVVVYVIMLIIFAVYGRHNLVMSPEEEYAVKNSKN
jgi:ethanolamine permease